jgi:hypothetical protein
LRLGRHGISISVKRWAKGPVSEAIHGLFVKASAKAINHTDVVSSPVNADFCG